MRAAIRLVPLVRSAIVRVWALPTTLVGLALASTALFGGRGHVRDGVLEAWGGLLAAVLRLWPPGVGAAAMGLGHVILAMSEEDLARHREHELVHVRQCERWGPLFLPAYAIASLSAWMRGRDPYEGNRFEREAFAVDRERERLAPARASGGDEGLT
jgi:hypothetical protein